MSVEDFEAVLSQIHDLTAPQEFQGGPRPISSDERLALAIRYMATGESLHSLSFQFRISRKAVWYIVKGCCDAWTGLPRIIRSKCLMKEWANQSNTKIVLEESEKVGRKVDRDQTFIQHKIYSSNAIFNFFRKFCDRRNRSNISFNMGKMLCWMKCWTGLPRPLVSQTSGNIKIFLEINL